MYCHLLHRGIYGIVGLIADVFRVWIGGEKGCVLSNSLRRKSDFDFLSSAERCPVSARSGSLRNGLKARGIPSNPRKVVFRLKVQYRCPMLGHPVAEARGGARPNNAKQTIPNLIAVGIGFVFVTKCEREMKRYDRNKRRPLPSGCKRERNKRSHVKSPRFRQQESAECGDDSRIVVTNSGVPAGEHEENDDRFHVRGKDVSKSNRYRRDSVT